jgi:hypothetical protein
MKICLRREGKSDLGNRPAVAQKHCAPQSDFACAFFCAGFFLFFIYQNANAQFQLRCESLSVTGGVAASSEHTVLEIVGQAYPTEPASNDDFILHPGFIPCLLLGSTTRVEEPLATAEMPTAFALRQNYPNPFNPATKIEYAVSARQWVSLKVYDVLGKEVATLIDERKPAGFYRVEFEARDLPSGVYFYKMTAGEFAAVRKLVLLR